MASHHCARGRTGGYGEGAATSLPVVDQFVHIVDAAGAARLSWERLPTLFAETSASDRLHARRRIFAQQDGLAIVPILGAFVRRRVFALLERGIGTRELQEQTGARMGYLLIALRALAASGWLCGWSAVRTTADLERGMTLTLTDAGRVVARQLDAIAPTLDRVESFLAFSEMMERWLLTPAAAPEGAPTLSTMATWRRERFGLPVPEGALETEVGRRLEAMLEGSFAAPIAVALARHKMVRVTGSGRDVQVDPGVRLSELGPSGHRRFRDEVVPAMSALGWWNADEGVLTKVGRIVAFFAAAHGVTASYLPLLRRAEELIFRNGRFDRLFPPDAEGHETHVDRLLNIWGSGGAHDLYFKTVDEVIVRVFDRPDHPLAICDTGCGDGSFLRHLAEVLRDRLGWNFFARPVHFIGSDLNERSRQRTRETLAAAGVPNAHVVDAAIDINDPSELDAGIRALGITVPGSDRPLGAADALHTNSMLIHNRSWQEPSGSLEIASNTDGAFVDPAGFPIVGGRLQANLVEFMKRWAPFVRRHGWLFIELHTVPADRVARDPGRSPTIAYDLTHGFSSQYTVELDELLRAAELAGLVPGPSAYCARFPDDDLTRISITYLLGVG